MLSIRPPIGNIEEFGYITLKFREEAGIDDVNHYKKTITFNKRDSRGSRGMILFFLHCLFVTLAGGVVFY